MTTFLRTPWLNAPLPRSGKVAPMLPVLTDMTWLNERRLRDYPRIFVAIFVVAGLLWIAMSDGVVDVKGKPQGYAILPFYSASEVVCAAGAAVSDLIARLATREAMPPGIARAYTLANTTHITPH